jgi:hypothetical protein
MALVDIQAAHPNHEVLFFKCPQCNRPHKIVAERSRH